MDRRYSCDYTISRSCPITSNPLLNARECDLLQAKPVSTLKQKIYNYQAYNKSRKVKAINFNPTTATLFFKIIPYLLHCNYKDLPGYIDNTDCKFGIYRFAADEMVSGSLFRKYFPDSSARSIKTPTPYALNPYIHSLKTIGSIGTIAQAAKSDCDYWVSVKYEDLGREGLELLEQKCHLIEKWAMEHGVEIYFFLMDIEQTRENQFDSSAEEESAGTALKLFLKDELFRTHILVAGKMLLWWLIPPRLTDQQYRSYVVKLRKHGLSEENYIDLGYLSDIPKAEIFGACLWQLNKALDSPFKSVIKFAYLELLLRNKEDTLPLFSSKILCRVTFPELLSSKEKILAVTDLDPYLMLARDIVAFYKNQTASSKEDNLIRECLFLKTLEGMKQQGNKKHQQRIMTLMGQWNLLPNNLKHYMQIKHWNYNDLLESGTEVHNYLLSTYKRLRWFFTTFAKDTGLTISQRDISILGRKLFTFYQSKPNKIEYIRSLSRDIMLQHDITFHITRYENVHYFYAFQGELTPDTINKNPSLQIRRDTDLLTLMTWLTVNGIMNKFTHQHLTKNFMQVNLSEIQAVSYKLFEKFPLIKFSNIPAAELLEKETMVQCLCIVNFHKLPVHGEKSLHSSIISLNNYGEHFIHHYTTAIQLKNQFRQLLTKHFVSKWNGNLEVYIPQQPEQFYIEEMLNK